MVELLVGAHLDNLDVPTAGGYARLRAMRARVVGTLWTDGTHHRRPVYDQLELLLDRPTYIVRVGPSAKTTPFRWATDAADALAQLPPSVRAERRVRVRCLNEVNLPVEGGWDPAEYAAFLMDAGQAFAADDVDLVAAPVSLGEAGWRDWWERFVRACRGRIPADRVAVNCYGDMATVGSYFAGFGRPVDVTELNTLAIAPGSDRARWTLDRCRKLAAAGVETVQIFIAGGRSGGAWDERYILADAEADELGRRGPIEVKPMASAKTTPWDGKLAVVWNTPRDVGPLVELGHELQLDGFDLKIANGASSWAGRAVTREQVAALKSAGFVVTGWAYNYDDLGGVRFVQGDGIPEMEGSALADAATELEVDGVTLDLEVEVEGHGDLVAIEISTVRDRLGADVPLAAHTWADLNGHEGYPFDLLVGSGLVIRPMVYRPVWRASRMWESLGPQLQSTTLVAPVWGVTEGTLAQLAEDAAAAPPAGIRVVGESYWEYAALQFRKQEIGDLVRSRFAKAPPVPPVAVVDPVTDAFNGLWHRTIERAAGGDLAGALADQRDIALIKTAMGR